MNEHRNIHLYHENDTNEYQNIQHSNFWISKNICHTLIRNNNIIAIKYLQHHHHHHHHWHWMPHQDSGALCAIQIKGAVHVQSKSTCNSIFSFSFWHNLHHQPHDCEIKSVREKHGPIQPNSENCQYLGLSFNTLCALSWARRDMELV